MTSAILESCSTSGRGAIAGLLRHALRATGCERAFLVRAADDGGPPVLVARSTDGSAGAGGEPSTASLRLALACARPRVWRTDGSDGRLLQRDSVRRMQLRTVLAAPVPEPAPRGTALVLDGRRPSPVEPTVLASLLSGFASLLATKLLSFEPFENAAVPPGPGLVGRSEAFREVLLHAARAARCELPVLIHGESGTGKEAVARQIHESSARRGGPFVAVNCAALPEGLMERELFGCIRGAFTGADRDHPGLFRAARGGSLLLDEIGDMPRSMQAKLLRALQERRVRPLGAAGEVQVDVRVLAASHRQIESLVSGGAFRADLFFRLAVLRIRIPPLRDRPEDLPLLIPALLSRLAVRSGVPHVRLTEGALQRMREHRWPGNVRELEAVLARAALRTGGGRVAVEDLEIEAPPAISCPDMRAEEPLEVEMIRAALRQCRGSVPRAAMRIGWSRQKLHRRMQSLGLRPDGSPVEYPQD